MLSEHERRSLNRLIYPRECRERGVSYKAKMQMTLSYTVNGGPEQEEVRSLGMMPVMVKSRRCHLENKAPAELVRLREDAEDLGGYFIVNGLEKLIRLLVVPRRNHVLGLVRPSFQKRGPAYTQYGTTIRCVRPDQTAQTIGVHYLSHGDFTVRFSYRKREYILPAVLIFKALMATNDREIYEAIVQGQHENTFLTERVTTMLRNGQQYAVYTQEQSLAFLGSRFRVVLNLEDSYTDAMAGKELLSRVLFVHLADDKDKFNLLAFMIRKLAALVAGDCCADNADSPANHEVLLPGHLWLMFIKEKLEDILTGLRAQIMSDVRRAAPTVDLVDLAYFKRAVTKVPSDVGRKLEYFLATGNLVSNTGLDLQQVSGYVIVAEKLNFLRYLSHFRSIHRGAFFAEIRTTTVRKLLPESWGFMCPVHTPDGAPCGLLNHLAHLCTVVNELQDASELPALLVELGMTPLTRNVRAPADALSVFLDGCLLGVCSRAAARDMAVQLRVLKAAGRVPSMLEIGHVPSLTGGQFPGLYLFTTPARFMRPVTNIGANAVEYVGSFEQVYMDIACTQGDIEPGISTHVEVSPTSILSVIANITPFSDFNQSPRNMYQCQMGKQSMGTPAHALPHRTDNKLYRHMFTQTPIVRPKLYNTYGFDNYPNGVNAVVAVIAYTGYDMDDAMILNKSSFERGFGHGVIYKSEFIDLAEGRQRGEPLTKRFGVLHSRDAGQTLDMDGLPFVGARLVDGDPFYSVIDETTGTCRVERFKSPDHAYVEEVRLVGGDMGDEPLHKVCIKLRFPRPPVIGDKFSSRHGQKGVCSQKYPAVDMPFSECGISPDVIINPNAFPSRMTIGMLIESMAAKSGAMHGVAQDATPFRFSEKHRAVDYFGEQLREAGFNYYGSEPMYSGINGTEFAVDIYFGVVYYQRLRHMVSDKFQVRTTGPVHNLTQQPVKGRKRAGGIRFGEMERDSLLGHGVSFMLHDRLMNCSDYSLVRYFSWFSVWLLTMK